MEYGSYIETKIGTMILTEDGTGVTGAYFEAVPEKIRWKFQETPLLQEAKIQLQQYFQGQRMEFDLPLSLKGTEFQLEVWRALCTIPYGKTRSYQDIAIQVKRPKAFRAVGMANHVNPVSIIIPCHRVIGKKGSLVGYGGGIEKKETLLLLEREYGKGGKPYDGSGDLKSRGSFGMLSGKCSYGSCTTGSVI